MAAGGRAPAPGAVALVERRGHRLFAQMTQHVGVIHEAMLADVAEKGGSGENAFVPGFNVCGKTGTAQVRRPQSMGGGMDHVTWFASYAPFEAPRYAVIVMVESGSSGGGTCAPKVGYIDKAIQKIEQRPPPIRVAGLH